MTDNNVNLKELLKKREKHYLESTQEIMKVFLPQLNDAIKEVIYDGKPISILVKGIYPLVDNLNYVAIVAKVSEMSIGDAVPIIDDEGKENNIKITKSNYWQLADTVTLNTPISVLETQDANVISEFLSEVYENNREIPINKEESLFNIEEEESIFDDADLDKAQQELLGLYNKNDGSKH